MPRLAFPLVKLAALAILAVPQITRAHDPTRAAFERQRARVAEQTRQQAEPAPGQEGRTTCQLTVALRQPELAEPVAGLLRITNLATGKPLHFPHEIQREQHWYAVAPRTTLTLPRSRLRLEAMRGLETERSVTEIDLTNLQQASVSLSLRTFYDASARGLVAGNTHLHLMRLSHAEAIRYLEVVPQADQLEVVFLSHLERSPEDRQYITNEFTAGDLQRLSREGVVFANGEEHRHNFGPGGEGYGHVLFLNLERLIRPVSIGPGLMKSGTDGRPLQTGIREARDLRATVIWCHNQFGHEDLPNWIAGTLDAQNIYDGNPNGTYADTYYRYLDLGMRVPFSTGTDWFIYDFSRVYVPLEGKPTAQQWLQQLAASRSYITNGPLLEFTVDGHPIGDVLDIQPGQTLRVDAQAWGRMDFHGLEIVHNGEVIEHEHSDEQEGHFTCRVQHQVTADGPGWIAARIPLDAGQNDFGKPLYAHTSPIYLDVHGQRPFKPEVARELMAEIAASSAAIAAQGQFANDAEREAVLKVYQSAITTLRQRLDP